jgi:hypothetical protein
VNLLLEQSGPVKFMRSQWSVWQPVPVGVALYRGDRLKLEAGAAAVILCGDLTRRPAPEGEADLAEICPTAGPPALTRRNDAGSEGLLPGSITVVDNPANPYVITPRGAKLLNPEPTLRWNDAIPGVAQYTVRMINADSDQVIWEATAAQAGLPYAGPPLEPGNYYYLAVATNTGSKAEAVDYSFFQMIDADEAAQVQHATATIDGLGLTETERALALAQLYIGHDLTAAAMDTLEGLLAQGHQQGTLYRRLGDLYLRVGLTDLARSRYLKAVELAEATGDLEGLAAAQARSGQIYAAAGGEAGYRGLAIDSFTQARANYELLGDQTRVAAIEAELRALRVGQAQQQVNPMQQQQQR